MLLFEFTFNSLGVLISLFVAILFFKKRALLPRIFIASLIYWAVGLLIDFAVVLQIPAAQAGVAESKRELVKACVAAAIWIPYFLISRRVKETFRS